MSAPTDGSSRFDEADGVSADTHNAHRSNAADLIVGSFLVAVVILAVLGYI
jgi:hypothetical protein